MDRNIKIARQLVRIARELVANDEINADADEKMQSGVIFDPELDTIARLRSASRSRVAFLESPWEGDDDMTMLERLGVMFRSIFKSKKTLEEEKRVQATVDEMNAKIDEEKKNIQEKMKEYSKTFGNDAYEVFIDDIFMGQFIAFRKGDSARAVVKFVPGSANIDIKQKKIIVDQINEIPFRVMIDIPSEQKAQSFVRGKLPRDIYNGGTNLKATFKSFDQCTKYLDEHFKK